MAEEDGWIKIKTKIEGLASSLKGISDLGLGFTTFRNQQVVKEKLT